MSRACLPVAFCYLMILIVPLSPRYACAEDGVTDLGTLAGLASAATAVSADGTVVVGGSTAAGSTYRAFRWTSGGGLVDLGTLGGGDSEAWGVSANGTVVIGNASNRAFRWTSGSGMVDLNTLGGSRSNALGVSGNGSVVVGWADLAGDTNYHAFRWTSSGMEDLGTLGGAHSFAQATSADGSVVVGGAYVGGTYHAFRWVSGATGGTAGNPQMYDLGTLGGTTSRANGVSADGSVVVGWSYTTGMAAYRAFLWTSGDGMVDLGTLGGSNSEANGVSADGNVVVGAALNSSGVNRAFRWVGGNMQSVDDWLRSAGVSVPVDITRRAHATNADGSVVVGMLANNHAFVARVASVGSGLVTLQDVQQSLLGTASGGSTALSSGSLLINGAHGRPLARRVAPGRKTFWLAGDWGRDDHGSRSGDLGLAEVGFGKNFGAAQVNVSLGQTWARQNLVLNGHAKTDGIYLLAEALIPVSGRLWATFGGYGHWGESDLKRGYLNTGVQTASKGSPDVNTWGLRARLDWENAASFAGFGVTPYADLSWSKSHLDGYTEIGGGFPARFQSRTEKATEMRLGLSAARPLGNGLNLVGTFEATHRFEKNGARTSGQVIGLFGFDLEGQRNQRDWLHAGIGLEGKFGSGVGSLSFNATTKGETPNYWLAANWQVAY